LEEAVDDYRVPQELDRMADNRWHEQWKLASPICYDSLAPRTSSPDRSAYITHI